MKLPIDNQFNNINAIIINSEEDINLDVMNTNQKISKFALFLLSFFKPNLAVDNKNEKRLSKKNCL